MKQYTKDCPSCNKEFSKRKNTTPYDFKRRKYCSVECSIIASIKRNQPAPRLKKHCKTCGKEFIQSSTCSVNGFKKRIYCSSSCAQGDIKHTGISRETRKSLNMIIENFKDKGEFRYRDISEFLNINKNTAIRFMMMLIFIGMADRRVVTRRKVYLFLTDKARFIEDYNKIILYLKRKETDKKLKKKKAESKKTKPSAINDMSTEFTGGYLKLMNNFIVR